MVDNIGIFEGGSYEEFFDSENTALSTTYERVDSMKREFFVDNPDKNRILLNIAESPNPLWKIKLGSESERGTLVVNGVTTGFITSESGDGSYSIILREAYYFCFVLMGAAFVLLYVILKKKNKKQK